MERIPLKVTNPFDEGGEFRVVLVEASADLLDPNKPANLMKPKEKRRRKIRARVDHGVKRPETPPTPPPPRQEDSFFKKDGTSGFKLFNFPPERIRQIKRWGGRIIKIYPYGCKMN